MSAAASEKRTVIEHKSTSVSGGQSRTPQQKDLVQDTPLNLDAEVLAALRVLREKGYGQEGLRAVSNAVGRNIAFGVFEAFREPGFVVDWEMRGGKLFVGGQSLADLIKQPTEEQLKEMRSKNIPYEPMPDAAIKSLLDAERALNEGATVVSIVTPGCSGTNFVQNLVRDPTGAVKGKSYHVEHVGGFEDLRRFQERIFEALGQKEWTEGGLEKAAISFSPAKPLDWRQVAAAAASLVEDEPSSLQRRWAGRMNAYAQDPGFRQNALEELATRIEELMVERLTPLLATSVAEESLKAAVLGSRAVAEKLLRDELGIRFDGPAKEGWHTPAQNLAPSAAIRQELPASPSQAAAWQAVAQDPQIRLSARGVRAQLADRHDLAAYGLGEKLEGLLTSGASGASISSAVDVSKVAELARVVAAYTNNPELSRDLYTLAESLDRKAKWAWRAVREGEISVPDAIPPVSTGPAFAPPTSSPATPNAIEATALKKSSPFGRELQDLLDEMARREETRTRERRLEEAYDAYAALLGRRSTNPILAALRRQLPIPEEFILLLQDKELGEEIKKAIAETTEKVGAAPLSSPMRELRPDTIAAKPIEAEEPTKRKSEVRERQAVLGELAGRLSAQSEETHRKARQKWAPLNGTEAYDSALIIELIEILNLPVEERHAILQSAGIDRESVALVERIERQMVIERKFRLEQDPRIGQAA